MSEYATMCAIYRNDKLNLGRVFTAYFVFNNCRDFEDHDMNCFHCLEGEFRKWVIENEKDCDEESMQYWWLDEEMWVLSIVTDEDNSNNPRKIEPLRFYYEQRKNFCKKTDLFCL